MTTLVLALLVLAFIVFALAAGGIANSRVMLVPAGLAAATLAELVRLWPP